MHKHIKPLSEALDGIDTGTELNMEGEKMGYKIMSKWEATGAKVCPVCNKPFKSTRPMRHKDKREIGLEYIHGVSFFEETSIPVFNTCGVLYSIKGGCDG